MTDKYENHDGQFPFHLYNCSDVYMLLAISATEEFGGTTDTDGVETESNSNFKSILESICQNKEN